MLGITLAGGLSSCMAFGPPMTKLNIQLWVYCISLTDIAGCCFDQGKLALLLASADFEEALAAGKNVLLQSGHAYVLLQD